MNPREEFVLLRNRVDAENPKKEDVRRFRTLLRNHSEVVPDSDALSDATSSIYFNAGCSSKSEALLYETIGKRLKRSHLKSCSNPLEQLLVSQIGVCWAQVQFLEAQVANNFTTQGQSENASEYWQRGLDRAHKRYIRSIEALARIQKLNLSLAFQVNIATDGGKQVNQTG